MQMAIQIDGFLSREMTPSKNIGWYRVDRPSVPHVNGCVLAMPQDAIELKRSENSLCIYWHVTDPCVCFMRLVLLPCILPGFFSCVTSLKLQSAGSVSTVSVRPACSGSPAAAAPAAAAEQASCTDSIQR